MPVLLQIDACLNFGSTGRITEDIAKLAISQGWECYIIHGARYVNRPSVMEAFTPGSVVDEYLHFAEHFFFDNDGLSSRRATKRLIKKIQEIKPDIIQLHDIHDHWLNYRLLFVYLNTLDIPVVWTQHDCWSFTGDCGHFTALKCEQWEICCTQECPFRLHPFTRRFINHAKQHYELKRELFTATKNLILVPVSHWLERILKESFLRERPIQTIYNGVDTSVFKPLDNVCAPLKKYGLADTQFVIGVATAWSERKGFKDYCKLSALMPEGVKIVLVGLDEKLCQEAEKFGIIGLARTENVGELVALYNGASIVMNLSYEETFGLTTVEGFACGTPSIVYNATASPELVTPETGIVVEPGDVDGVTKAVCQLISKEKPVNACRERAALYFNKDDRFQEYIDLYESLIKK